MSIEPVAVGEIVPDATLEDCERVFRQGGRMERQGALQQGLALMHIRDNELYKQTHRTFEAYCEQRLNVVRSRGYHLISLAKIVQEMSTNVDTPKIANEGQARAIKPVLRDHGPEVAAEVLREAADDDGNLTARAITEAAEVVTRPTVVSDPAPELVEVLTVDEWAQRNEVELPIEADPDPDDFLPEQSKFERRFWQHLRAAQELVKDLDYPQHFNEQMTRLLIDLIESLSRKQDSVTERGLRVVNGGKR